MANDFLLDDTGDLKVVNGDLATGDSTQQDIELLLLSKKGEWKEFPMVGANIQEFLKQREGHTAALKEARIQLRKDNLTINKLTINNSVINVDAERQ